MNHQLFRIALSLAQAPYPDRPVTEAPGREPKQTIVVENKADAGGALGIAQAARASADAHTLLLSLSSISTLPKVEKLLDRKPAYPLNQFKPIARFTADPLVRQVVAKAGSPLEYLDAPEFQTYWDADASAMTLPWRYARSASSSSAREPVQLSVARFDHAARGTRRANFRAPRATLQNPANSQPIGREYTGRRGPIRSGFTQQMGITRGS